MSYLELDVTKMISDQHNDWLVSDEPQPTVMSLETVILTPETCDILHHLPGRRRHTALQLCHPPLNVRHTGGGGGGGQVLSRGGGQVLSRGGGQVNTLQAHVLPWSQQSVVSQDGEKETSGIVWWRYLLISYYPLICLSFFSKKLWVHFYHLKKMNVDDSNVGDSIWFWVGWYHLLWMLNLKMIQR